MINTPFIAVEGPIGVGKTSLAQALSEHFQLQLLKEIVEENPFLGKFYENINEWSFQTEMFFLCNRYKQLEDINSNYIQKFQPVVSDYHIFKNLIFAERTLQPEQYDKYFQIYQILTNKMPAPNLIIYLHASLDTLLNRIQIRGREIEKKIDPHYLDQLSKDYDRFIHQFQQTHPHIPLLIFNGDDLDFVNKKNDLQFIMNQAEKVLKKEQVRL